MAMIDASRLRNATRSRRSADWRVVSRSIDLSSISSHKIATCSRSITELIHGAGMFQIRCHMRVPSGPSGRGGVGNDSRMNGVTLTDATPPA